MPCPGKGEIIEINEAAVADPGIVNREPYGGGWIAKVRPEDWQAESAGLADWLDRAVAWLGTREVRVYGVLDRRQADEAKARFSSQRTAAAFDRPFLIYEPAGTALFDLSQPRDPALPAAVIREPFPDAPHCDPPVPLQPLILK